MSIYTEIVRFASPHSVVVITLDFDAGIRISNDASSNLLGAFGMSIALSPICPLGADLHPGVSTRLGLLTKITRAPQSELALGKFF